MFSITLGYYEILCWHELLTVNMRPGSNVELSATMNEFSDIREKTVVVAHATQNIYRRSFPT